jgi:hypothetical protein
MKFNYACFVENIGAISNGRVKRVHLKIKVIGISVRYVTTLASLKKRSLAKYP